MQTSSLSLANVSFNSFFFFNYIFASTILRMSGVCVCVCGRKHIWANTHCGCYGELMFVYINKYLRTADGKRRVKEERRRKKTLNVYLVSISCSVEL